MSGGLHCHAWSQDRTRLVVAHGGSQATVLARRTDGWEEVSQLAEHDLMVTSIDWAPVSNLIVTCSQDRNAYVWERSKETETEVSECTDEASHRHRGPPVL